MFVLLDRKERFHGFFSGLLLISYAPVRFLMDFMRAKDLPNADIRHFGLTPAQYGALILFGMGCWMLLYRRDKGRQDTSSEVARDYPAGRIPDELAPEKAPEAAPATPEATSAPTEPTDELEGPEPS